MDAVLGQSGLWLVVTLVIDPLGSFLGICICMTEEIGYGQ